MEIKILKNTKSNRLILIDKSNGQAFISLDKKDKIYKYLIENRDDEIEDYKPTK